MADTAGIGAGAASGAAAGAGAGPWGAGAGAGLGVLSTLMGSSAAKKQSKAAMAALEQAKQVFAQLQLPSIEDMTMPELQKYIQAGILSPAQAQAVTVQKNAYDSMNVNQQGSAAEIAALNKLQDVANSGGLDAQSQAKLTQALDQSRTQLQGQRGAIEDQMAQRGLALSPLRLALERQNASEDARTANSAATQAAADAETRALQALSSSGQLGGQLQAEQFNEAANKAAAANAIAQFNAQSQTGVNTSNAAARNAGQEFNITNAQNTSNQNVGASNQRTQYNTGLAQQNYNNALAKATGEAGAFDKIAQQNNTQAGQQAGLYGGLAGVAGQLGAAFGRSFSPSTTAPSPAPAAQPNTTPYYLQPTGDPYTPGSSPWGYAEGGPVKPVSMRAGGTVPGNAPVEGDSSHNDIVRALLSPDEIVVPRSAVQAGPDTASSFVRDIMKMQGAPKMRPSVDDVRTVLQALSEC